MNDQWTTRLSEYIDGELDNTERAAIEAHLATCGRCYATLGELRQVVARAKSLEDTPPADRKSTRLNSSHGYISYAVFCLKKKNKTDNGSRANSAARTSACTHH